MNKRTRRRETTRREAKSTSVTLPNGVIMEILLCLPVKSLLRFRCVNLSWKSLIDHTPFVYSHLDRSWKHDKISLILHEYCQEFMDLHSPINFQSPKPASKLSVPLSVEEVYCSCNGLLLCLSTTHKIFLLNPSTRSYKRVLDPPVLPRCKLYKVLGLGYSSLAREYKVVQVGYIPCRGKDCYRSQANVYTLGRNSWRDVDGPDHFICTSRTHGTLLHDCLHWIAVSSNTNVILSFDFASEKFHNVPLPEFEDTSYVPFLGSLKGCICVSHTVDGESLEIWVMKEYRSKESWTLQFSITPPRYWLEKFLGPLRFFVNGEILLRRQEGRLVLYEPWSKNYRDVFVPCFGNWYSTIDYVESLVAVNAT